MDDWISVKCCKCGAQTPIIFGVASTITCQRCGHHEGVISGKKIYTAFCPRCEEHFHIKAGIKVNLKHSCGSQVVKITNGSLISRVRPSTKKVPQKTSIVIPVWDKLDLTKNCIESIRKFTKIPYQLVIIDNGSNLETIGWLSQNLSDGDIVIRNTTNIGFTAGCNQGIKVSTGHYILLLNNDTVVQAHSWLTNLIDGLDKADLVGATYGKIVPDRSVGIFRYVGNAHEDSKWAYLEGWCLLAEKKLFDELGGFDEQFSPAYSEDSDLSFRVKKMGKKILKVSAQIHHIGQQSAKMLEQNKPGQSARSNRLLYKKWLPDTIANILIKRDGAFGDVIFTTPIIKALSKKHPSARLFYKTKCPQALQYNPYIYKLLKTAKEHMFDKIYTLEYEKEPQYNCIDVMAKQAGVKLNSRVMDFPLIVMDKDLAVKEPYAVMHTGKVWESRHWPIDKFQRVAEHIMSKGISVVEIGDSRTDLMSIPDMNALHHKYICESWNTVGHLINGASFFFGVDSGPSVVAKALQTPSILIYGCVDSKTRFADSEEYPLYIDSLDCSGCRNRTTDTFVECSQDKTYCLDMITVDMAISVVNKCIRRMRNE